MPLDRSHQHISSDIMQADNPQTPINPEGGSGLTNPLTEDLDAGGERITNLGAPSVLTDAARLQDLPLEAVLAIGNDANAEQIKNLADPTDPQDAATLAFVFAAVGAMDLGEILAVGTGADGLPITNLADPIDPQDAATKVYVDDALDTSTLGAGMQRVTIDLDAADIATLNSVPVEVVAAQGAGKVIVPVAASFQYKAGAFAFATGQTVSLLVGTVGAWDSPSITFSTDGLLALFQGVGGIGDIEEAEDAAVVVKSDDEPGLAGSILTASLADAGTGYAPGDTGTIAKLTMGTVATYEIDTVGGGGEVATFHVTDAGTGYAVAAGVATDPVTGGGDNEFRVDIDSITPLSDGTARLTVLYFVMDLLV